MARTKQAFDRKRNELLIKIWDIFLRNGYEDTTLALIREELSIPKGVFYHYFHSKEECADLCIALFATLCTDHLHTHDFSGLNAEQKLIRQILFSVRFFNKNKLQHTQINAPANTVFHQKLMIALTKLLAPVYSETISQGVREGLFDTEYPFEAAQMLLTLSNFYLDSDLFAWEPETIPDKIRAFSDAAERILGAAKGTFAALFDHLGGSSL